VTAPVVPVTADQEARAIAGHVAGLSADGRALAVLDAGCGRGRPVGLDGVSRRVTGLDIDAAVLRERMERPGDLDEAVVGDVRNVDFGDRRFDVVYCGFVLEHVPHAHAALTNLLRALAPDGLMIIRTVDRDSALGFVRSLATRRTAGAPGGHGGRSEPVLGLPGLSAFCAREGLEIVDVLATRRPGSGSGPGDRAASLGLRLVDLLTVGRRTSRHDVVTLVIRRRPSSTNA
jgi:SAM-dependent methyltransferase